MAAESGTDQAAESGGEQQTSPEGEADGEPRREVEVLEFVLGETRYCTNIAAVEEVVEADDDALTPVPKAPEQVSGVMDLRGTTTTIIDPKRLYDVADDSAGELVLVFDTDQLDYDGSMGWLVDHVDKVSSIDPDDVDTSVADSTGIKGVVNRGSEFLLWVDPETVAELAQRER